MYGLALGGVGRADAAMAAFERAAVAGHGYAELNIISMLLDAKQPQRAKDRALAMRDRSWLSDYEWFWVARYVAIASLDLGDEAVAEQELRAIVDRYQVSDAEKLDKLREALEIYIAEQRPGAAAAGRFVDWVKPRSYEPTPDEAAANRAWWRSLPDGMRAKLCEEINKDGDEELSDEELARCLDVDSCSLYDSDGLFDSVEPFLRLKNLERLGFYGDPDTIEPLRSLPKLEQLTINNVVIKQFAWPSRTQRDLWKAAEACDKAGMERALAAGAKVNARSHDFGKSALSMVAMNHDLDLVLWLISQGADPWAGTHADSGDGALGFFGGEATSKIEAAAKSAGIGHPDDDPYRLFSVQRMPRCATFETPGVTFEDAELDDGDSLLSEWPRDVQLAMAPPKKDNKIYDIMRVKYDEAVVSEKVADVLRADRNIELLPVTLLRHDGKSVPGTWYFVNPLAKDCLVIDECYPQWNHIDPDSASEVCAYVIDPARVGEAQMFRPTILNRRPMIVTRALAAQLAGFEGARIDYLKR